MQLENTTEQDVFVLKPLEKRVDARCASDFKRKISDVIESGESQIVIEMGEVEFIDSSGLGAIVSGLKLMGDRGEIAICSVKDTVMSMFKLTRMDKVFQIFPDKEQALTALAK